MSLKKIPLDLTSPDYSFQIQLDGRIYGFQFVFNARTDRWAMSLFTEAGEPIVTGLALVTNWAPLDRIKDDRLPPGRLFIADITGGTTEPNEITLGDSVLLCYDEATT